MGCLNSTGQFSHWFGNIHLSGPCNRACYFCIGQHMMAQDALNTLNAWPLPGLDEFLTKCKEHGVRRVYLTGTNTDPALYRHLATLRRVLRAHGLEFGIRTNGVRPVDWSLFDAGSVTICSLKPLINIAMMGGPPADIAKIRKQTWHLDLKVNVVLGPENRDDVCDLIRELGDLGIRRVNLREPYGQPHVGNPMPEFRAFERLGMPVYRHHGVEVTYWDVHYVEVESVNLYASGRVSETYPITKGCAPDGVVQPQSAFPGGRVREQWVRA